MANDTSTEAKSAAVDAAGREPDVDVRVPGRAAADAATSRDHIAVDLPWLGKVQLPHPRDVAFYAGLAGLAALELIEWPAAVALAVGHALVGQQQHRRLHEFGEALEDA